MNHFIKARPAEKQTAPTSWEKNKNFFNGLSKVEGIITSAVKLQELLEGKSYYWIFFALEGLKETEIPVIFRLEKPCPYCPLVGTQKCKWSGCGYLKPSQPNIPPRSKILLKGTWAESLNSNRPSFTCSAYEILISPPPLTIKDLKEQISSLLSTSLDKKQEWQARTDYLFKKQKDLQELEKLSKLGPQYLQAYLLLKSASYANYQDNLLPLTTNLTQQEEFLAKLAQEIEEIAYQIRAYQSKEYEPK